MREKEPVVDSRDYGRDEDAAEALLKKHQALMADVEAFETTIRTDLRAGAAKCKNPSQRDRQSIVGDALGARQCVIALYDYVEKSPREVCSFSRATYLCRLKKLNKKTRRSCFLRELYLLDASIFVDFCTKM